MAGSHADIKKHIRVYLIVFGALAVFTVLTVTAAGIKVSGAAHVGIALLIASIKATLVALIFMHLKWERGLSIWWTLVLSGIFFAALIMLPLLTNLDDPPQVKRGVWDVPSKVSSHGAAAESAKH